MKQQRDYINPVSPGDGSGCCLGFIILIVLIVGMVAIGIVHKYL